MTNKAIAPVLYLLWAALCPAQAQVNGPVNVTTYHNDNAHTGQNISEFILTPANVNQAQFGKLFAQPVDGFVYAQPLYVSNLRIAGSTHDVVFVATEHDSVYAFDADSNAGADINPLWHASFINPSHGITTVAQNDIWGCGDLTPEIGISGTPVIDLTSNTLYAVANTKENGVFFQRLHALDITSGAEKFGGPVAIQTTVTGIGDGSVGGQVSFDPLAGNQRPSLLLENGLVYITWASHCDIRPYHGWLMAYDAHSLLQVAVWNSTANGYDGGIWQSGASPAGDADGNVFVVTGNGDFNLDTGGLDAGDSVVKFGVPTGSFPLLDYFTPFNQSMLDLGDVDLGSGGVLLLPDLPAGAPHPQLLTAGGKQGTLYLIDRNAMGEYNPLGNTQIVQSVSVDTTGLFSTPAFWNNTIYVGGVNDSLKAYSFNANNSGLLSNTPISVAPEFYNYPGTTPSVSANGSANGIVWALQNDAYAHGGPAVLHAYDATNLGNELYNTVQKSQDTAGPAVKFTVPTIANGKVYAGGQYQLTVYGLQGATPPSAPVLLSPGNQASAVSLTPTLTWSLTSGAASYDIYFGTSSPPPLMTNSGATSYSPGTLAAGTVYYWMIVARNSSGDAPSPAWAFTTADTAIQVNATLDGAPWSGPLSYQLNGLSSHSGTSVPATYSNELAGSYTLAYVSGGPAGATLASITPSATETLSTGATVTFYLNFTTLSTSALRFVPVTPCRVVDTRNPNGPFGGPSLNNNSRDFPIPSSSCNIPSTALAYSLNVTAVPSAPLGYLTIWSTGQPQPVVSTLNSGNGIIKADAAIVPAGANGSVSVYAAGPTDVVLDINGYFVPGNPSGLAFYPLTPCRVVDTRNANGPLGGPIMTAGQTRSFPLLSGTCSIPPAAQAYSVNFTVVPSGPLWYLTTWPDGQAQPVVSTLNAPSGLITANAAILPAGATGAIDVYTSTTTQVVIDINGYFAPPGAPSGLSFYIVSPCRAVDTRNAIGPLGGPAILDQRDFPISTSGCALPASAQAYSLNATVVPVQTLGYLTLWPTGAPQPVVSTLNSPDGSIVSNAAIVPAQNGSISTYASDQANLILDANGYFAP